MRRVYEDDDIPVYLDVTGRDLLVEGRRAFQRLSLRERPFLRRGRNTLLLPWAGDRFMNTLALQLRGPQVEWQPVIPLTA